MKIFIDFDDVILNTKLFKKSLVKIFSENGVPKKDFEESYRLIFKNQKTTYTSLKHIGFFAKNKKIDSQKISFHIEKLLKNLRPYVFNDVKIFLKHFPKNNLYLLSYGDLKFQKQKIKAVGVSKYFKRVIVTNDNKLKIIKKIARKDKFKKGERIIFIDDKPSHIKEVKQGGIITFQIIRPYLRFPRTADFNVRNLKEIENILLKNLSK
jgi:FMN phosphatase YigB (HAD superfamily)